MRQGYRVSGGAVIAAPLRCIDQDETNECSYEMAMSDSASFEKSFSERDIVQLGKTTIDRIPDAVIHADRKGIIRFWNVGAARIFGFSAAEAVGQSLDIIIPQRLRQRHWDGYEHMMATGLSQRPAAYPNPARRDDCSPMSTSRQPDRHHRECPRAGSQPSQQWSRSPAEAIRPAPSASMPSDRPWPKGRHPMCRHLPACG